MSETLIDVKNLSKKFSVNLTKSMLYGTGDAIKGIFGIYNDKTKLRKSEFWALKDVSFQLKRGETLGIIGINGSGKSTLLRLLNGIFPPDEGRIEINGRIGALIAVGAGFHPHMTGRENIYLNGTILGMTKKQIDERYDEIVEFSEIGDFLEAPVATYSSGMRVKLGFAIAIHSNPDILLVDEILSVGDLSFRNKSLRKMHEFREKANGIIFISHNMEQVRLLCDKTIVLNNGKIIFNGPTHQAIIAYEELTNKRKVNTLKETKKVGVIDFKIQESSGDELDILNIGILDDNGNQINAVKMNTTLNYFCDIKVNKFIRELYFSVGIITEDLRSVIWVMSNDNNKVEYKNLETGNYRIFVNIENHHLIPNVYIPNISIRNGVTGETYERILPNCSFRVMSDNKQLQRGIVSVNEKWNLLKI